MKYVKGNPNGGLTPLTSAWMHKLLEHPSILNQLVAKYGSPINIHNLSSFEENIRNYQKVFQSHKLKHKIYYARKANRCRGLVKQALSTGIGVDTASYKELLQSLALGGDRHNLVLTSAIKTTEQIELAIKNNITIILDNYDECKLVNAIAKKMEKKAEVGIRVSGVYIEDQKLYSRFGFDIEEVAAFVESYIGGDKELDRMEVGGLHFHLDGYSIEQRAIALSSCIALARGLKQKGYSISFIDMGGGILMNYLADEQEWKSFDENLRDSVMKAKTSLTFNGTGLGYKMINGKLEGKLDTYPFYNRINGATFIDEILNYKAPKTNLSNAHRLIGEDIEIRIEPGRSLLNLTGITVAKVAHRKRDSKGQWLVGLEMNMSQLMSSSADFLLDPYIRYQDYTEDSEEVSVYFTGAYCLERDILLKRKISLPQLPKRGDLVVFINTAGYMMHFFETEAHLFELSKNIMFKEDVTDFNKVTFIDDNLITKD